MNFRIAGLGEVLWDLLPGGRQMGGAPANFACHARALGAEAHVISRVGQDADGAEILSRLLARGVRTECVEVDRQVPTGTVSVTVGAGGQPRFTIHENVAWDHLTGEAAARALMPGIDAVCFGTLAQRHAMARAAICSLVDLAPRTALRVLDVNLRQEFHTPEILEQSLARANVVKVNDAELPHLAKVFDLGTEPRRQLEQLAVRWRLVAVACTRGERGSVLLSGGRWSDHPGVRVSVVDTVGAGDSFTAAMTLGLLAGWDLDVINERANRVAAHVASCAGATPELPRELRSPFLEIAARM